MSHPHVAGIAFDPLHPGRIYASVAQEHWLDVTQPVDIKEIGTPRSLPGFTLFPVDRRVGNVRNDEPSLAGV